MLLCIVKYSIIVYGYLSPPYPFKFAMTLCSSPLVMIGCPPTALGSVLGIKEKHEAAVTCNVTVLLDSNMTTILFIAQTGDVW